MSEVVRTKEKVGVVNTARAKINNGIAAAALEAGQPVYLDANGKYGLADADGSGSNKFRGFALATVAAGQSLGILEEGELYGFTLTGAYDSLVYVSDDAGKVDTSAGSTSLAVGRVVPVWNSKEATKVLKVTGWAG